MGRRWLRLAPVVTMGALLALAVQSSTPRAGARPEPAATSFANCGRVIQQGDSGGTFTLVRGAGIDQPIVTGSTVLSCSIGVVAMISGAWVQVVEWDPQTLLPDPTKIALRSRGYGNSVPVNTPVLIGWYPPLVTKCVEHLAEAPRTTVALDYENSVAGYTMIIRYQPDGPADAPAAYSYTDFATGARTPLPGAHPVLNHVLCSVDSTQPALSVVQSVVTPNYSLDSTYDELLQRFRVPVETRLRWVELAFTSVHPRNPLVPGTLGIVDAQWWTTPPLTLPVPLVGAALKPGSWRDPVWDSHFDFDQVITLKPDHDYWLWVATRHCYGMYTRRKTGGESADFLADIGPFSVRTSPTGDWVEKPDQTLCFKLIGEPTGATSAPPSGALRLRASPNPSLGSASIGWADAVGEVRFEVIDARGRRVGEGHGFAGRTGDWLWRGTGADGRRLPAGMYFVRATDGAGRHAVARVTLVR